MKPVVTYDHLVMAPQIGRYAVIAGIKGHPRQLVSGPGALKGDVVATSPVVRIGTDGEFETENTIYRPEKV